MVGAHRGKVIVLGLIWVALALRVHQIDLQSWWWDEGYSAYLARSGILAALQLTAVDIHPPLYYVLLSVWGTFAGYTEFTSRLFSAFLNLAAIPLIYQVGKRGAGERAGVFAALILTIAPAHVYYSQEVRMYTLFALEYLAALWLLWRLACSAKWDWRSLTGLAFVEAAMMYTHYFSVVGIGFLNLAALIIVLRRVPAERWVRLRQWIGGQIGALVLYLPWLPFALRQSLAYEDDRAKPLPFDDFVGLVWHFFNLGIREAVGNPRQAPPHPDFIAASGAFGVLLALALVVLLTAWIWQGRKRQGAALAFWAAAFVVPLLIVFGLMFWKPTIHPRYVLMVTPAILLSAGAALAGLIELKGRLRWLGKGIGLALGLAIAATSARGLPIVYSDSLYFRADARGTARFLSQAASQSDAIVIDSPDFTIEQYYNGVAPILGVKMLAREAQGLAELQTLTAGKQRAFLVRWDRSRTDDRRFIPFLLERAGRLVEQRLFHGYGVWVFALEQPVAMPPLQATTANFGDQLLLRGVFSEGTVHAGEGVAVALSWELLKPTDRAYKVAVALSDEEGRVVSNRDMLLMDERHRYTFRWEQGLRTTTYHVVPAPLGAPPGAYRLTISVYEEDEATGWIARHLDVLDVAGNPAGHSHALGWVDVRLPRQLADPYETLKGIPDDAARPLGEGLMLRGASLPLARLAPGERLPVVLLLSAEGERLPDDPITVEVVRAGQVLGAATAHVGNGRFPTSAWKAGFPVLERRFVLIAPEAAQGTAEVRVRWGERPALPIGQIELSGRARRFDPPAFAQPIGARYPAVAELVGASLVQPYDPTVQTLVVSLVWRADNASPLEQEYVASVQVLNSEGRLVGQSDHPPAQVPTTSWVGGEFLEDRHQVVFREPLDGEGRLIVVLYDAGTLQRLTTQDGRDAVALPLPLR